MLSQCVGLVLCALLPLAAGHCKITSAQGDASNNKGTALGIQANSGNSQADVTILKGQTGFGNLVQAGPVDPAKLLPAVNAIPQVSTGGTLTMTLHQINGDGAGPMTCSVDPTSKGTSFQNMQITTNVPGNNGKSNAANADFPLVAQMPAGVACTGDIAGVANLCMVKCQNPAGPFGGVVPVQSGGGGGATAHQAGTAADQVSTGGGNVAGNAGTTLNTNNATDTTFGTSKKQGNLAQGQSNQVNQGTQGQLQGKQNTANAKKGRKGHQRPRRMLL
ncbi:MAG: hypothetical protein Q9218_005002 [Villophora microphyllina]